MFLKYEIKEETYFLIDEELGIHIQEPFVNALLKEGSYYVEGLLHGPSVFHDARGTILTEHWYYRGNRHGKGWQYYISGNIYALERYFLGQKEGLQEFYYEDGSVRSFLPYTKGKLQGQVVLFWPNGKKKRGVFFEQGIRKGWDRIWSEEGTLIEELYAE